jgi:hypothetical protein
MRKLMKKRIVVLGILVALAATGLAVAYWTQAGSGSGSGTVGTTGTITLTGTVASGIYPGGTAAVALTAANSGSAPVNVQTVSQNGAVTFDAGHAACVAADFSMPTVTENVSVPGNATAQALTAGVLSMTNSAVSQDACKGATITITLAST